MNLEAEILNVLVVFIQFPSYFKVTVHLHHLHRPRPCPVVETV